jgi:hypothetical protein
MVDGVEPVASVELLTFLLWVVGAEHLLLLLKLVIENVIEDVPAEVQSGERERQAVIARWKHAKDKEDSN